MVPPGTGIVHQVNLEYLARVVMTREVQAGAGTALRAYPDTCVGTDSHTTMVNGLGVLGWGVGGIEAEAAMLGQPVSMLIPRVVGFKLTGEIPPGATATDVVLTITQLLRRHGVVGKFVEFYGEGVAAVPLANRATIGNMSPEFGSTCAIFPIDDVTLEYLRLTGRPAEQVALVEAYAKEQGLWHDPAREPRFSEYLELDLSTVVPSLAGPRRPQDRVLLSEAKTAFRQSLRRLRRGAPGGRRARPERRRRGLGGVLPGQRLARRRQRPRPPGCGAEPVRTPAAAARATTPTPVRTADGREFEVDHGSVVIASITSCTNTSNPSVMVGAGLLAKKAVDRGLAVEPWVKTSLAPGSKVVVDYYERAGLMPYLEKLGFHVVGFGCTTCIGNSGPLSEEISAAVQENDLAVVSVLSGNRNFEGRINPDVKMNYLASPPLVIAYALAGTMDWDVEGEPLGTGADGTPVYLRDIWPSPQEVDAVVAEAISQDMFTKDYADVFAGDERWRSLPTPTGDTFAWDPDSTYVRKPPYFEGMSADPAPVTDVEGARVLALLGDSVTTDHISPAGSIKPDSPAGRYLVDHGIERKDFNSYGSRRGNHEVMIRGTFANIRLRNRLLDGVEGGYTRNFLAGGEQTTIYDAAQAYAAERRPAGHPGRQGVRLRVQPGLGGQGDGAARGPRGPRGELRADPPLQPHRDGRPAPAVPGGGVRGLARHRRLRDVLGLRRHRDQRRDDAAHGRRPRGEGGRSRGDASTPSSGSTRPERRTTTATAASCPSCSASSPATDPSLPVIKE